MLVVETTLPADEASQRIVETLLEDRLAACANWWRVGSAYWWEGQLEHADEWLVAFKTTEAGRDALVGAIRDRHPYDLPYIAWHRPDGVDDAYADWVDAESGGSNAGSSGKPVSE